MSLQVRRTCLAQCYSTRQAGSSGREGGDKHGNNAGELSAIIVALYWILNQPQLVQV